MSLLARIAPYALIVAVIGLTHWWAYNRGEARATAEHRLQLQEIRTAAATAAANAERAARDKEAAAAEELAAESMRHLQESRHAQMEIDHLRADLRAARVRLSVPVARCTTGSSAGSDPATAGGSGSEARAELMPQTAADLVGIAADGDAAVRQLNRCIDVYNAVRMRYNEGR